MRLVLLAEGFLVRLQNLPVTQRDTRFNIFDVVLIDLLGFWQLLFRGTRLPLPEQTLELIEIDYGIGGPREVVHLSRSKWHLLGTIRLLEHRLLIAQVLN